MEQYYKISADQVNSLLNYLKGKPYIEVWQGMNMLQTLPAIPENCAPPKDESKTTPLVKKLIKEDENQDRRLRKVQAICD